MRVISSESECLTSIFLDRADPDAEHKVQIWIDGERSLAMRFSGTDQLIPDSDVKAVSLELLDDEGQEVESLWL